MISIPLIASYARKEFGEFASTDAINDSDLIKAINSSSVAVVTDANFAWNVYTTTVTTNGVDIEYTIPFNIQTFCVLDADRNKEDISRTVEEFYCETTIEGVTISGDKFYSGDDAQTYTIVYRGYPPTVTTLSGNLDIPQQFYDAVLAYTIKECHRMNKNFQRAQYYRDEFKLMMKRLSATMTDPKPNETVRIGQSYNF